MTLALLLAGLILRVLVNNVAPYSQADEAAYVLQVSDLNVGVSYHQVLEKYFSNPQFHIYPPPTRWGYLFPMTFWCGTLYPGPCDARALASFSTFASILALLLVYAVAREMYGRRVADFTLALSVVSPLQLHLGRRALTDTWVLALGLATALFLVLAYREHWLWLLPACVAGLFLVATKEWYWVLLFPLWPAYWALTGYFAQNWSAATDVIPILWSQSHTPYSLAYQSGWWHRALVDYALLSPLVLVLAIGQALRWKE
jgi:hypothetical protein